jgi:MtN3 and saliva related transmembrane protein
MNLEFIGFIAALLTTVAFVPQVWHSWKTRDLSGVSIYMYMLFTTGVLLWFVYGIVIKSWPVIIANAITGLLAMIILALKVKQLLTTHKTNSI